MKLDHSSLEASVHLGRNILSQLEFQDRDFEKLIPYSSFLGPSANTPEKYKNLLRIHWGTLAPFKGTKWYEDEDVKMMYSDKWSNF